MCDVPHALERAGNIQPLGQQPLQTAREGAEERLLGRTRPQLPAGQVQAGQEEQQIQVAPNPGKLATGQLASNTSSAYLQHRVSRPVRVIHIHGGGGHRQAFVPHKLCQGARRLATQLAAGQVCGAAWVSGRGGWQVAGNTRVRSEVHCLVTHSLLRTSCFVGPLGGTKGTTAACAFLHRAPDSFSVSSSSSSRVSGLPASSATFLRRGLLNKCLQARGPCHWAFGRGRAGQAFTGQQRGHHWAAAPHFPPLS